MILALALLWFQGIEFVCPMDPEVRAKGPGKCWKCGMALEAGIPRPQEYPMDLRISPAPAPHGEPVSLRFLVRDPKTGGPVRQFTVVHAKLFHLFLVSRDLEFFAHEHPIPQADGSFCLEITLPKPGIYRLLADYYPKGGTPQLTPKTLITRGYTVPVAKPIRIPAPDLSPKRARNISVEVTTEPAQPVAGKNTRLVFHISPKDGLEPYLGAWAHLLAASHDLIDTIHAHPTLADGGPDMQFDLVLPREATYRVWAQFQRKGVVNTVAFTIPAVALR
jgi:hypothetical protein